jgi:hypothetical protein
MHHHTCNSICFKEIQRILKAPLHSCNISLAVSPGVQPFFPPPPKKKKAGSMPCAADERHHVWFEAQPFLVLFAQPKPLLKRATCDRDKCFHLSAPFVEALMEGCAGGGSRT